MDSRFLLVVFFQWDDPHPQHPKASGIQHFKLVAVFHHTVAHHRLLADQTEHIAPDGILFRIIELDAHDF